MIYPSDNEIFVGGYAGNKKLSFAIAGAGVSLALLQAIPGSSRIVDGIYLPYSDEAMSEFLDQFKPEPYKAVSKETAYALALCASLCGDEELIGVGVTGALTTNRYRKGDNEAFICIIDNNIAKHYHLKLNKFSEEDYASLSEADICDSRLTEDMRVVSIILHILDPNLISLNLASKESLHEL